MNEKVSVETIQTCSTVIRNNADLHRYGSPEEIAGALTVDNDCQDNNSEK